MGIRQLQTFIQKDVPNGYPQVSLIEECEAFKSTHQERPILLIDFMGIGSLLLETNEEMLCGLRYNKMFTFLDNVLQKMSKIADLVFYSDGVLTDEKLPEFIRRQNSNYEISQQIFDKIVQNWPIEKIIDTEDGLIYSTPIDIIEHLAKKYGTLKTAMARECDTEMAQFACKNSRVLAIMTDDSDFLIFPGEWRYFSLRDMDGDSLVTMEYNRKALREFLNLNDQEMPLLATLNGNDFITFDENFRFHKSLGPQPRNPSKRFPAIAKLIKNSHLIQSNNLCKDVTFKIFKTVNKEFYAKVQHSLRFYKVDFEILPVEDELLKYCIENSFGYVYSTLNYMLQTFSMSYLDLRQPFDYFERQNIFVRKLIGIVLRFKQYKRYKICTKKSYNSPYALTYLDPITPNDSQPPILELINASKYPEHESVRFSLLKWLINKDLLLNIDLRLVSQKFLQDILVVTYLVSENMISTAEADIILLTVKYVEEDIVPESISIPETMNPRAFILPFLFNHSYQLIEKSLQATGLTYISKLNRFDGVLFHKLFKDYIDKPAVVIDLLGNLAQHRFYKMHKSQFNIQ